MLLEIGAKAPAFTLPDQNGAPVSLSDFAGKKVVLYFYPKDSTSGCTREAQGFAAQYAAFGEKNTVILGVSRDSQSSHKNFAAKYGLPFALLSDPERAVIEAYGVWQEKKNYGKTMMGIVRTTYLIDEAGVIEKVYPRVKPDTHAGEILAYLNA